MRHLMLLSLLLLAPLTAAAAPALPLQLEPGVVLAASPAEQFRVVSVAAMSAAPAPVLADAAISAPSPMTALGGQVMGLALAIVLAPLLAVLAHKYLPAAEKKLDDLVDASPFFKQHERLAGFARLFCHALDLELIRLSDAVVADAKAEGRFTPALAAKVKNDAIDSALDFVGQTNRDALAQSLGITVPGAVDEYLNKLLEARLATLKAQGLVKQPAAPAPQPAPVNVVATPAAAQVP